MCFLKNDINIKEKELFKNKIELQELNAVKQLQSENYIVVEDKDMKRSKDLTEIKCYIESQTGERKPNKS